MISPRYWCSAISMFVTYFCWWKPVYRRLLLSSCNETKMKTSTCLSLKLSYIWLISLFTIYFLLSVNGFYIKGCLKYPEKISPLTKGCQYEVRDHSLNMVWECFFLFLVHIHCSQGGSHVGVHAVLCCTNRMVDRCVRKDSSSCDPSRISRDRRLSKNVWIWPWPLTFVTYFQHFIIKLIYAMTYVHKMLYD